MKKEKIQDKNKEETRKEKVKTKEKAKEKVKTKEKSKKENIEVNFNINKSKLLKGIGVVAVVLVVIGLAFFASKNYGDGANSFQFTDITIDEYLELLKTEEKKIVYVAKPTCSYCQLETPIIKKLAGQYDLEIYYLNTEKFYDASINDYTEDGYKFIHSSEIYKDGIGTPNTIIIQNGKIVDGVYQYVEASELKELFERNDFINGK